MSKYCPLCDRQVVAKKKTPWVAIVASLVLVGWFYGLGVLLAIALYVGEPSNKCPICGAVTSKVKPL